MTGPILIKVGSIDSLRIGVWLLYRIMYFDYVYGCPLVTEIQFINKNVYRPVNPPPCITIGYFLNKKKQ